MQIYAVMRPHRGTSRKAMFRYGSWVYTGEVDFGVPALHLGDIPEMLPALQRQQGRLAYTCDVSSFPTRLPFFQVAKQYMAAVAFLHDEMVAAEETLAQMAEVGMTSWIDAEWAASFFELALDLTPELEGMEAIASKTYFESGIVLHCVLFGRSLYCVLASSVEDLPLLDVAFPDVTARCRGAQIKAYGANEGPRGRNMPRARRLTVWEGRRKGARGVGWGTASLIDRDASESHVGDEIRERARKRAVEAESARQATLAMISGSKSKAVAAASSSSEAAAPTATAGPDTAKSSPAAKPPHHLAPLGLGAGMGAKAPHHLAPLGAGGGRLLSSLPPLDAALAKAPWDSTGKPLGH
jgi:hypothetical protein